MLSSLEPSGFIVIVYSFYTELAESNLLVSVALNFTFSLISFFNLLLIFILKGFTLILI